MSDISNKRESSEAKKEREQREARELKEKRERQLVDARRILEELEKDRATVRSTTQKRDALANHSFGFYDEVNKLAKGRSMLTATELVVERANEIIRDAKEIVREDKYLDRVKEFVPAGDNPVYPDILISIRAVRDSLKRYEGTLLGITTDLNGTVLRANTIVTALEYFLDDETDENSRDFPSKDAVEEYSGGHVSESCFFRCPEDDELYFDFDALDEQGVQSLLKANRVTTGTPNVTEEGLGAQAISNDEDLVEEGEEEEGEADA